MILIFNLKWIKILSQLLSWFLPLSSEKIMIFRMIRIYKAKKRSWRWNTKKAKSNKMSWKSKIKQRLYKTISKTPKIKSKGRCPNQNQISYRMTWIRQKTLNNWTIKMECKIPYLYHKLKKYKLNRQVQTSQIVKANFRIKIKRCPGLKYNWKNQIMNEEMEIGDHLFTI